MNIVERHRKILEILQKEGYVDVNDLSDRFEISAVTIRKDLKLLEEKKLLYRSHGRAVMDNPYAIENPVQEKEKIHPLEKNKIALMASQLVVKGDHLIIASGTSVIELARQIKHINQITVLSASLDASLILSENKNIDIIQLGGMLRSNSSSVIGPLSEKMISEFSFTKLFLGVDGIDLEYGFSTTNAHEASLNKKMMLAAQRTIVLADSSKFGKKAFGKICDINDVHQIITDSNIDPGIKLSLEEKGIEMIIV